MLDIGWKDRECEGGFAIMSKPTMPMGRTQPSLVVPEAISAGAATQETGRVLERGFLGVVTDRAIVHDRGGSG